MSNNKSIKVYLVIVIALIITSNLHARLGFTKAQCDKKYGKAIPGDSYKSIFNGTKYEGKFANHWYYIKSWQINVKLWNDKVYFIHYQSNPTVSLNTLAKDIAQKNGVQSDFKKFLTWQKKRYDSEVEIPRPKLKYWFQYKLNYAFMKIYNQSMVNAVNKLIEKLKVSISDGL